MSSLAEVQRALRDAILHGRPFAPPGAIHEDGLPVAERIAVYRNSVLSSLAGALASVFPATRRLVGAGYFRQAAGAYARRHPSRSGNLHGFGAAFPAFLAGLPEMAGLPYTADVGRIEWARQHAYHARDEAPFPLARLAAVDGARRGALRLSLTRSATLLASRWPALAIWQANRSEPADDAVIDAAAGGECTAVWRSDGAIAQRRLSRGEHAFLSAVAARRTLADAISTARDAAPDFEPAAALRAHVATGLVNDFSLQEVPEQGHPVLVRARGAKTRFPSRSRNQRPASALPAAPPCTVRKV